MLCKMGEIGIEGYIVHNVRWWVWEGQRERQRRERVVQAEIKKVQPRGEEQ